MLHTVQLEASTGSSEALFLACGQSLMCASLTGVAELVHHADLRGLHRSKAGFCVVQQQTTLVSEKNSQY